MKHALAFAVSFAAFAAQAQQQAPYQAPPPPQRQPQAQQPRAPQQQRAPQAAAGADSIASFGWFAELAGSCWKSVRAEGRGDVQCYTAQYNRFMRATIKFYQGDKLTGEGDSVFAFDPNANLIVYSQWVSNGSLGFGQATLENGELVFQNSSPEGPASTRSVWRKADADSFKVSRQRRGQDGAWKEEQAITYTRVAK